MARVQTIQGIAIITAIAMTSCGSGRGDSQIAQYRLEIKNGIERAFADVATDLPGGDLKPLEHYVSPDGKRSNDGTEQHPWDLATALSEPSAIRPGDIIWLRAGVYNGSFTSELVGRKGAPIIVRQYPGERATLDGCTEPPKDDATLTIKGEYSWFWDFEVTNCRKNRVASTGGSSPPDLFRGTGVDLYGTDMKLIDLVIHDTGNGIGAWIPAKRAELSGNLVYYNGYDGPDRGHGHGIYVQNELGPKYLINNVIFDQFGSGIHAYAEKGAISTLIFDGNIVFTNGSLSARSGYSRNILVGGQTIAEGITLSSNVTYYPFSGGGGNMLGYEAGCTHSTVHDNIFAGPDSLTVNNCADVQVTGNEFIGSKPNGISQVKYPQNEFRQKPTGVLTEIRTDRWEPGRAYVAIYNWEQKGRIRVDISKMGWKQGQKYRLRNVQNYFDPGLRGVFDGDTLDIPMTGWSVAAPVGMSPPHNTLPEFGVFVLEADDFPLPPNTQKPAQSAASQ